MGATVGLDPMSDEFVPKNPRSGDRSLSENSELFAFTSSVITNKPQMVLLSTSKLMIADNFGMFLCASLDCGCQSCFVSKHCAGKLNLKKEKINIVVSGMNKCSSVTFSVV
ncbi:hypothetical protein NPIL_69771 [Nephila pilipes]|uniref:Uncharacterized protein n=1 Tax=Nephila pilipes TaxID=299642 RepID=A0A8X6PN36_NEPPI|nr:hypothetical protein NPIL_69771 [Nephila pilipes]